MALTLTITNAGRAALVAAGNLGTNAVQIVSCGVSPTAIIASPTTSILPGEIKRLTTLSGSVVAADTIHATVRDESTTAYETRSIALYLADGTLFAAYGQTGLIASKSAQAMLLLTIDVQFADIAATQISFGNANFLNPPATTETAGVVELATDAETITGTDSVRAVTPKGFWAALNSKLAAWGADIWRAGNDGAGSGLDADLLDGQQGSFYTAIAARLGFTPANKAGDTFTGPVTFSAAISGLSATFSSSLAAATLAISSAITRGGNTVWDAGNDGAGSGCDADLLDGQQGSFYTAIAARLGFTPANKAGDTFTGPVVFNSTIMRGSATVWDAANDGAGSGCDADLLDGQQGAFYTAIAARLGFTPANRAGETFTGPVEFNSSVTRGGNLVWDVGNDGAGSGMDADLLDGQHGSFYASASALNAGLATKGPLPQIGSGVGQFVTMSVLTNQIRTPSGGTWAWWYMNNGTGGVGISAGDTLVFSGTLNNVMSQAIRIA